MWALIGLSQQNQPENNHDETVAIYVTTQGKQPFIRNGIAQFGYPTIVTGYHFRVNVSYLFNLLTVAVKLDGVTRFDTVYIDAEMIDR